MRQERLENLLMTIDKLRVVKIKHLQHIHDLGTYRNAARVVLELSKYTNQHFHRKEKVIYLNKEGRNLIGSSNEVKITLATEHTLLRNEVYIHLNCPINWENEYPLEVEQQQKQIDIVVRGLKPSNKRRIVCDAMFSRNGYSYLIEIDNTRDMKDNQKKIDSYAEILPHIRGKLEGSPKVHFYTTTENRKKKLSAMLRTKGISHEVFTFDEIR